MAMRRVGFELLQAVAIVEQRRAEGDGHGQIVGKDGRPQEAVVGGRVSRVQGRRLAPFHQKGDAVGQGVKQALERGSVLRDDVETRDRGRGRLRRCHARLMEAVERLEVLRCRHRRARAFRPASPGLESQAPGRWRRPRGPAKDRGGPAAARLGSRRLPPKSTRTDSPLDPDAKSFGSLAPVHSTPSVPFSVERSSASAVTGPLNAVRSWSESFS